MLGMYTTEMQILGEQWYVVMRSIRYHGLKKAYVTC